METDSTANPRGRDKPVTCYQQCFLIIDLIPLSLPLLQVHFSIAQLQVKLGTQKLEDSDLKGDCDYINTLLNSNKIILQYCEDEAARKQTFASFDENNLASTAGWSQLDP